MIRIEESKLFNQTISTVIDGSGEGHILSMRATEIADHEKTCARYHAKKRNQGLILVKPLDKPTYHIKVENSHVDAA